ncbi:hypothetical protein TNCV_3958701 [Trichonephila clavipes]|nr:hypothetical protein TNCV_3958701 [Trichonephila clavipes]
MSAEATTVRDVRPFIVATAVSQRIDFRWLQKKKCNNRGLGRRGGRSTGRPRSNPPPRICGMELVTHHNRTMRWCTNVHEPHVLVCIGQLQLWDNVLRGEKVF